MKINYHIDTVRYVVQEKKKLQILFFSLNYCAIKSRTKENQWRKIVMNYEKFSNNYYFLKGFDTQN